MNNRVWTLCALVCAFHVGGTQAAGREATIDIRAPIVVTEQERSLMLEVMREHLHGLHSISMALGRRDMDGVALASRGMGMIMHRIPQSMRERLPDAFVQMGIGQHEIFEAIARDALTRKDTDQTLGQVSEALTYCSGCHDTYRFVIGRPERAAR
jgi:hypothetical protein